MQMGGIAVAAMLLCVACGDDSSPADAGGDDSATDTALDVADATTDAPLVCPTSSVAGCHESCQEIYDCVVTSSVAPLIEGVISMLGFAGDDFSDCSPCVTSCEEGAVAGADEPVLACLAMRMEMLSCMDSPDPTVITDSVNACCAGDTESFFCRQTCRAVLTNEGTAELFPVCLDVLAGPLPPSCAGTCPDHTGMGLGVVVGPDSDFALRSADVDPAGRIALTGKFNGTVDFGGGELTSPNISKFVAVYEPDGSHAWSQKLSDGYSLLGGQLGNNIMFDTDGNLLLFAELIGTADFGDGERTAMGAQDAVLLSWNPSGTLRWARQTAGPGTEAASEIDVRGTDVWMIGTATDSVDWGGGPLAAAGMEDVVVARFDGDGVHQWSRRYGGSGNDPGFSIAAHPNGDHTLVSMAPSGIDFGLGPHTTVGDMGTDWYIVRIGDDGALRWVEFVGVGMGSFGYRAEADGDAVFAQTFLSSESGTTADFQGTTLTSPNQVMSRLDAAGTATWIHETVLNGTDSYVTFDTEVEADGGLLVGTNHNGTLDFGAGPLTAEGGNVMVTHFDTSQVAQWAFSLGAHLEETVATVDRLASGELVVVGSFQTNLDIGPEELTSDARDIFVLRFEAD